MSHLGTRVSALLDGELSPDVAARAHAHLAVCGRCRSAVEHERAVRAVLLTASDPAVPAGLTAALLTMGGPAGPLPPRPGHVPGGPRPPAIPVAHGTGTSPSGVPGRLFRSRTSSRPGGRLPLVRAATSGATQPRAVPATARRRRVGRRVALAVLGSVSVASVGMLSAVALGGLLGDAVPAVPATSQLTVERGTRQAPAATPAPPVASFPTSATATSAGGAATPTAPSTPSSAGPDVVGQEAAASVPADTAHVLVRAGR